MQDKFDCIFRVSLEINWDWKFLEAWKIVEKYIQRIMNFLRRTNIDLNISVGGAEFSISIEWIAHFENIMIVENYVTMPQLRRCVKGWMSFMKKRAAEWFTPMCQLA